MSTQVIYVTKEEERLDRICYEHYRKQKGVIEWVMNNNPELKRLPMLLPAGVEINLLPMPSGQDEEFFYPWSP